MAKKSGRRTQKASSGLVTQLRSAITDSGLSLQEIGRQTGIGPDRLSRFIRGERGLSLDAVEKLCLALHLRLVGGDEPPAEPKKRRKKGE